MDLHSRAILSTRNRPVQTERKTTDVLFRTIFDWLLYQSEHSIRMSEQLAYINADRFGVKEIHGSRYPSLTKFMLSDSLWRISRRALFENRFPPIRPR